MQDHCIGISKSTTSRHELTVGQVERFQHTHVIGQTGTGKSHFLKQSFMQDIYAGFGGCFFDFHGEDARWFLDHIPPERINDVIYFNPLDTEYAVGYNVLNGIDPSDYANFTDDIVASLRHIFADAWGGRMDDILTMAIRPLLDLPGESRGTMLGVVRMLNDAFYRNWVVKQCPDQTVRDFWLSEYAGWSKNDKAHNLNSSLNKIRRFQSSPILQRCLGQQKSRISIRRAIEDGQIVICDFNKWKMGGKNASTLASLLISRLIYEGTRRTAVSGRLSIPFHIYIDEFQTVTSLSAIEALSGIRKYRVGFTLAHQYASQIPDPVLNAIKGNVGTRVVFRVGGEDADRLQRSLDITNAKELTELSDYHFISQYKSGSAVTTNRGETEPLDWKHHGYGRSIERQCQAKYALPVDQVDETHTRWMQSRHYGGSVPGATVKKEEEKPKGSAGGRGGMKSVSHLLSRG